jgi:hypothetical protein
MDCIWRCLFLIKRHILMTAINQIKSESPCKTRCRMSIYVELWSNVTSNKTVVRINNRLPIVRQGNLSFYLLTNVSKVSLLFFKNLVNIHLSTHLSTHSNANLSSKNNNLQKTSFSQQQKKIQLNTMLLFALLCDKNVSFSYALNSN